MGKGGKGASTPKVQEVAAPSVAATPPEPEAVAEAPKINDTAKEKRNADSKRRGTSALRIDLNVGGGGATPASSGDGATGNGLSIPVK